MTLFISMPLFRNRPEHREILHVAPQVVSQALAFSESQWRIACKASTRAEHDQCQRENEEHQSWMETNQQQISNVRTSCRKQSWCLQHVECNYHPSCSVPSGGFTLTATGAGTCCTEESHDTDQPRVGSNPGRQGRTSRAA